MRSHPYCHENFSYAGKWNTLSINETLSLYTLLRHELFTKETITSPPTTNFPFSCSHRVPFRNRTDWHERKKSRLDYSLDCPISKAPQMPVVLSRKHLQVVGTGKVLKPPQAFLLWCGMFALQVSGIFADVSYPSKFKIILVKRKTAPFCQAVALCQLLRSPWVNKRPRATSLWGKRGKKKSTIILKTTRSAHCQQKSFRQVAFVTL